VEEILASAETTLRYDIAAWLSEGRMTEPSSFRMPAPERFVFELDEEGRRELTKALRVWTTQVKGLSKLVTRIKIDWQVRQCRPAVAGLQTTAVAAHG
jgi:hypothetical protein